MSKRVLLILILAACTTVLSAKGYSMKKYHSRGSAFELAVGGGYGSLGYQAFEVEKPWTNTVSGRPSGYVHFAYDYFFCEYVGLSLGADFTRYGSALRFSGLQQWNDVVDTDNFLGFGIGEKYNHILMINKWQEIQSVSYVEVPLSLKFSAPAGEVYVIGEVGAKLGIPVLRSYHGKGSLTHTGYYEPWNLTLDGVYGHGFYTEENYRPSGTFEDKTLKWSVFAKLGVAIPLVEHLDLTVQAFGQYAFTGAQVGGEGVPGFRDDREGFAMAHYFMSPYYTMLASGLAKGVAKPWHAGLELGIRYTIPHRKKMPCMCLQQQYRPAQGRDDF